MQHVVHFVGTTSYKLCACPFFFFFFCVGTTQLRTSDSGERCDRPGRVKFMDAYEHDLHCCVYLLSAATLFYERLQQFRLCHEELDSSKESASSVPFSSAVLRLKSMNYVCIMPDYVCNMHCVCTTVTLFSYLMWSSFTLASHCEVELQSAWPCSPDPLGSFR